MLSLSFTVRSFWTILISYCLFGMHFFMHNQGGSGLYLPFNMIGWAFFSIIIGVGLWHITIVKKLVIPYGVFFLLLGFLILLIPFLNDKSEWSISAQPRFIAILGGVVLFFSLSQFQFEKIQRHNFLYLILFSILIEILFSLIQFFFLKEGNAIGYDYRINRPYGIFQKDSVLSSFLATGIAISLYLQRWDGEYHLKKWKETLVNVVLVSSVFLLMQIQSRAGIIGAVLVFFVFMPVLFKFSKIDFWASFIFVFLGFVVGLFFFHSVRGETYESYYITALYRTIYYNKVIDMFWNAPYLGYGYGGFEYNFLHAYRSPSALATEYDPIGNGLDHPHNELLFWLFEGGLVAVTGLFVFAVGYIRSLLKCSGWAKRVSLFALVLPLLFHSMVEYPFYHSVAHFFLFVVFLWLADAESGQQKAIDCHYWFLARMLALAIPLLVVPFMLTGLQGALVLTKYERMKDKNPQMLSQIINPLPWMTLYEFQMRSAQLTFSAAMHDQAGLQNFVDWAQSFLHNTPRAAVYAQLVFALQQLNDQQQAQYWLEEGKRLFPYAEFLQKKQLVLTSSGSGAK